MFLNALRAPPTFRYIPEHNQFMNEEHHAMLKKEQRKMKPANLRI